MIVMMWDETALAGDDFLHYWMVEVDTLSWCFVVCGSFLEQAVLEVIYIYCYISPTLSDCQANIDQPICSLCPTMTLKNPC